MDTRLMEHPDEPLAETPEDVAILYSWANLHGAKYRDFSASRREYRAQVRHRAAEELRLSELAAKAEAERAAADADRAAREAERAARSADQYDSGIERERALRAAEDAARKAGAERVEAARRAEAAAMAEAQARREEREIAEAHASAQRQARNYSDSETRRRQLAGPQPSRAIPGLAGDPYEYVHTEAPLVERHVPPPPRRADYSSQIRYRDEVTVRASGERRSYQPELEVRRRPQGFRPDEASSVRPAYRAPSPAERPVATRIHAEEAAFAHVPPGFSPQAARAQSMLSSVDPFAPVLDTGRGREALEPDQSGPAWLYANGPAPYLAADSAAKDDSTRPFAQLPVGDTLQYSREQVASRWFALKGVFEPGRGQGRQPAAPASHETGTPMLAVFSLAGGVGKTSLVATLGRALSSLGEKVLLADTTSHGLLPFYFGASELRPGVVRTFSPPSGSTDSPIHLVSYVVDQTSGDAARQDDLLAEMAGSAAGTQRVLLDLNATSGWMIRRLARLSPTVLVPVAPDMNSVISLQSVEHFFDGITDAEGRAILPHYVLNQFDASLPLHLDVREVLRRQLGERLLPFVVRRAPSVSEALAEGMTVVDYAPDAAVAEDYLNIAGWLRDLSAPAAQGLRSTRWSER